MTVHSKVGTPGQVRATKALLKFCRDHHHTPFWIQNLETCLSALEQKNEHDLSEIRIRFSRAGMGSFSDWYPNVVFQNEDADYVEAVWYGLHNYWCEMMRPFEKKGQ